MDEFSRVIRLPPYQYLHVLDTNCNVTRVLSGPQTYTRQDHEKIVSGPNPMVIVPPQSYVVIENPVVRNADGIVVVDTYGQAKLRHGEREIRVATAFPDPFPLYAGEIVVGNVQKLKVLDANSALRIRANRDFDAHAAGDEWLFLGPATYIPRIEEDVVGTITASVIKKNQALKLRAEKKCVDCFNVPRDAGEEWLVRHPGTYLPRVDESVLGVLTATILTDKTSIYLRALRTFKDVYNVQRKAGEEWLVTSKMAETHVQDVHEEIISHVPITTLTSRQYCVVLDPVVNGVQQLGTREIRRGETSFFLQPGERLEAGIQDVCILADDEAVLLQATESFQDGDEHRAAGVKWMVYGPCEYVPRIEVTVLETRKAIPLDKNEGIYVRDTKTGKVRAETGRTYMLQPTEELWEKKLPDEVEELLQQDSYVEAGGGARGAWARDPTRVVTFEVPHNAAIQIYDYSSTRSRIMFGPTLVMLSPEEQFTVMKLSGDVPKRVKVIRTLCLQLGPDFMRDQITVETSDHARLRLTIAYNWHFQVPTDRSGESAAKIFSVRDFTGDACKTLASRIRGAVAVETFDHFHKHSARIIRTSIFGIDEATGEPQTQFVFSSNNLVVTNVDIQSAEPVDAQTRDSLQKSVQLAIEITTKSQEAKAKAVAMKEDEEAKGLLVTQQLENQTEAEKARKRLVELSAQCAAVEAEGAAVASAKARAQAAEIEAQAAVTQAQLRVQALQIEHDAQMRRLESEHALQLEHAQRLAQLELQKKRELVTMEADQFQRMVDALGQQTLVDMARAGPDAQAKMLAGLGLQGYLLTDGKSPVNLLSTAQDLIRNITKAE
ncbi:major vault protein [Achlya hypogyna]|uniref:Major vault protein n=1 Tax=Achlya hypogyna TaxID=1202772 RepID=A0A1V9YEM0_ACHHY|nr:major vault protein [Achlya hypogyna]